MTYLQALVITLGVEVPVVAACFPRQRARMAMIAAVARTGTHLLMHQGLPALTTSHAQNVLWGETLAVGAEAMAYAVLSRPRRLVQALIAAGLANSLSYLAGLIWQSFA